LDFTENSLNLAIEKENEEYISATRAKAPQTPKDEGPPQQVQLVAVHVGNIGQA